MVYNTPFFKKIHSDKNLISEETINVEGFNQCSKFVLQNWK